MRARVFYFTVVFLLAGSGGSFAAERSLRETVDAEVSAVWKREKITAAPAASDSEFLRRVFLDLVGTIPTYDETLAFLTSTEATKREQLIDRLLEDPRYAQHQADLWDMVLFGRNPPGYDTDKREHFQTWLRDQFAKNTPYDELARQILKADGNTVENGAPMYFVQYKNQPEDATEAITQTFLGVQVQCARCHDHPFENWTQLDFYGVAAFLARLEVVTVGKKDNFTMYAIGEKSSGDVLFTGPVKEQTPGKKGSPVKPKFLLGDELPEPPLPEGYKEVKFEQNKPPPKPTYSRKDQFADWITRVENPFFAKAIANRLWASFMGRGIVHPVDNMSASNKPSHPELMNTLAQQLVEHKFDMKWFVRELVNSRTYQLSAAGETGEAKPLWFQQARIRPLSAEELTDAWRVATSYIAPESANGEKKRDPNKNRFAPLEGGYMLRFFGQPNNGVGDFQGGLQEHLYLNNGPLSTLVSNGKGRLLDTILDANTPLEDRVDRLYLALLTRYPTSDEKQKFIDYLSQPSDKKEDRTRDAIWALMTCSEFRFNH